MELSFDQALIDVWRQVLVENADVVVLSGERYPVRQTPKRRLRQVDFTFDRNIIRGLEQNPETKSRWAQMARSVESDRLRMEGWRQRRLGSKAKSLIERKEKKPT